MTDFGKLMRRGGAFAAAGALSLTSFSGVPAARAGSVFGATPAYAATLGDNGNGNIVNSLASDPSAALDNPTEYENKQIPPEFQFSDKGVLKALEDILRKGGVTNEQVHDYGLSFCVSDYDASAMDKITLADVKEAFAKEGVSKAFPIFEICNAQFKGLVMTLQDCLDYTQQNKATMKDFNFTQGLKEIPYARPQLHLDEMGKVLFQPSNTRAEKCLMLATAYNASALFYQEQNVAPDFYGNGRFGITAAQDMAAMASKTKRWLNNPVPGAVLFMTEALVTKQTTDSGASVALNLNNVKVGAAMQYSSPNFTKSNADTLAHLLKSNKDSYTQTLMKEIFSPVVGHSARIPVSQMPPPNNGMNLNLGN